MNNKVIKKYNIFSIFSYVDRLRGLEYPNYDLFIPHWVESG